MNICSTRLKLKKYLTNVTESNLQRFTRIKNLDDFERDKVDTYLRRAGLLSMK